MAVIKKVVTAEQKEAEKQREIEMQQAKENLKQRLAQTANITQSDINDIVVLMAKERGLIEDNAEWQSTQQKKVVQ